MSITIKMRMNKSGERDDTEEHELASFVEGNGKLENDSSPPCYNIP